MKYFASGWGTMIADVLCSGTRSGIRDGNLRHAVRERVGVPERLPPADARQHRVDPRRRLRPRRPARRAHGVVDERHGCVDRQPEQLGQPGGLRPQQPGPPGAHLRAPEARRAGAPVDRPHHCAVRTVVLAGLDRHRERHPARRRVLVGPGSGTPRSTSRSTAPPSPATTCPARIPGRHEPAGAECAAGHLQRWPDPVGHPLGARRRRQRVPLRDDEAVQPRPRGRVGRPGAVRAGHEPERVGYSTDVPAPLDWATSSRWRSP